MKSIFRKGLLALACSMLVLCMPFIFVGCQSSAAEEPEQPITQPETPVHEHAFNVEKAEAKYLASAATHIAKAQYYYSCTCGEKGSETFTAGDKLPADIVAYTAGGTKTYQNDICEFVFGEDTTLPWSPKDTTVGRNEDGNWLGVKVTAPAGMDTSKIKYTYQPQGDDTVWKSFDTFKDGDDYIGFWGNVKQQYLNTLQQDDEHDRMQFRYYMDWNGDGEVDVTIYLTFTQSIHLAAAQNA